MNKKKDNMTKPVFRMTRQRRAILAELRKVTSHPTADAVYRMVRRRLPNISLSTVYRNLEILSNQGLIQNLELSGFQKRYDGNPEMHYHIRCVRCGRVDDAPIESCPVAKNALCRTCGYKILGYRLEFVGICPQCRKLAKHKKRKE